jgi:Phage tail sheath protein subtilisin-like domain
MATAQANQKVYVSPGVYTSETDLSFVAQSVGVTTLGLVGETIKGPAFEPVFITNYDEFQAYFGGTEPVKFYNTQIPKYEASYIAKSYLQQSNQLFVTRVLGLSGYDAGPSWSLKLIANVDPSTIGMDGSTGWTANFSGTTGGTVTFLTALPAQVQANLNVQYRNADGSTSTLQKDFNNYLSSIYLNNTSGSTAVIYGAITDSDTDDLTNAGYTGQTNVYKCASTDLKYNDLSASSNDTWYYANFDLQTGNDYSGYSFYYTVDSLTGTTGNYAGTISGILYSYSGTAYSEFNNMVIATLRSRGISLYDNSADSENHGPIYQVTGLTDLQIVSTGQYSGITQSPYATFLLSGVTKADANTGERTSFSFETSLLASSSKYITKVLGVDNFGKSRFEVPVFVEESYQGTINYAYNQGYIRGLSSELIALPDARSQDPSSIAWNLEKYQSPETPYLVSELRGNKVYNLFKFISISDGDSANVEIKVSIANLSFNNMSFDVLVRNFYDTDANPVVIEKFTNCNMDPASNNFVAKKIGSSNGEFALISKYIMIELADEAPIDAIPCGFYGYTQRQYASSSNPSPYPKFKTKYYYPGEVIYNPPFGTAAGTSNAVESPGDVVRKSYLGFSTQFGIDESFLTYKGKQNPVVGWETATDSIKWNYLSKGFHMDSGATVVTIGNLALTSGQTAFECGDADFRTDPATQENPYYFIYARKYTVCFAGGFDGWDIYREWRTNQDRFQLGASGYLAGAYPSSRYPTATGDGLFKRIIVQNNTQDFANTDYYAYLLGILSFGNPEATNINVFATSSIDYVNNSNLVEEAIDMVQYSRADSVYIATTPDYNMYTPDSTNSQDVIYSQEAVDNLNNTGIDSNYTATYYPWILVRDTVNNTQIYLPPTGEVCRNLALTDNIAFPWFASAGYTRGLVNSIKARQKLTQQDRDTLYQGRINPIATFSDVGTVIWGNKTLQVADTALNRLNVRRLLLQARKLISAVAVRLLFEQNDQIVRQQFLDSVNPILDSIRRDRGLYDFRVTVSSSPEDLDRNTLTGKIYLKPTKALEFIDIEFFITPTGASFENI